MFLTTESGVVEIPNKNEDQTPAGMWMWWMPGMY
jgi:hypothetical protein